jgi:nicotinate-nucleotide adenylyltransferase
MRLGVFGGTFDPVHVGHLILAEQCREQGGLDRVLFLPAARPPHKQERELTSFERRVEMLQLALAGNPGFSIEELEKDRPGPSYTADTLGILQKKYPGAELFLLLGSDSLLDLPFWYEPLKILEQATLLIVARPGWEIPQNVRQSLRLPEDAVLRFQVAPCPLIDIASRELRHLVSESKSIRYMVPRAVEVYIQEKKLYRA